MVKGIIEKHIISSKITIYVYKFLKSDKFYETVRVLNNGSVNGCVVIINIAFKYSRYSPNRNHIAVSTCKNPAYYYWSKIVSNSKPDKK